VNYLSDNEFKVADRHDSLMVNFLAKFDLTEKEKRKFLANRSGLIKLAQNFKDRLGTVRSSRDIL
tara:strand:- start:1207 stop:1401 length:195 start_codon:yes stop_codon:yes gene_type:complete